MQAAAETTKDRFDTPCGSPKTKDDNPLVLLNVESGDPGKTQIMEKATPQEQPKMEENPEVELRNPDPLEYEYSYWIQKWSRVMSKETILEYLKCNELL